MLWNCQRRAGGRQCQGARSGKQDQREGCRQEQSGQEEEGKKKQPNKSENVHTHRPKCATKAHYSFLRLEPLTEILTLLAATWANRSFNHSTSCARNTICGDTVPGTQQVAVRACYRVNASNGMGSITFHLSGKLSTRRGASSCSLK